jgi:phage tail-like protein
MNRRTFPALLFLAPAIFVGKTTHAQQPAPSPRPVVNAQRFDPYKNFKFRVAVHGKYLAGFSKMALTPEGSQPQPAEAPEKLPGRTKYEAITLERGVTHDNSFSQWANQATGHQQLQDVVVDVFNEAGQKSTTHTLRDCTVVEARSVPNLDGAAYEVAIQHMTLHCRGK